MTNHPRRVTVFGADDPATLREALDARRGATLRENWERFMPSAKTSTESESERDGDEDEGKDEG
jgi:hypothetical protein